MRNISPFQVLFFFLALVPVFSAHPQPLPADHPISLYRQGTEARAGGNYYTALEYYQSAIMKNPSYYEPIFSSAEIYFFLEEYDQALAFADRALSLAKDNILSKVLKARILVGMGDLHKAGDIYRAVLAAEPNNLEARLGKAELDIAQGKNRTAAVEYLETLQAEPNNRRALLSLALISQSQGDLSAAGAYFELSIRYHGESPITHLLAGDFYLRNGKADQAERHARTALSLKPNYEEALMLLGSVHLFNGRFEAVYAVMDTVLSLNRNSSSAWYLKGISALRLGKPQEAIGLLRTLLNIKPEDEIARITLEDTLKEFLAAEDPLRRVYADYHFDRGDRFQERNLFARAYEEYRRGLQINPYSKRGRIAFADILSKVGFQARSLSALTFLQEQKLADRDIAERIEIAESLLEDRVARTWRVDQFLDRGRKFSLSLFVDSSQSSFIHQDAGIYIARYFADLLSGSPRFALSAEPLIVGTFGGAFQEARQRGSDYFVLLKCSESEREFVLRAELYLSRTGGHIDTIGVYRTGNDRIQNGLVQLARDLTEKFPVRGTLKKREFERGLVDLGLVDGIKEGDSLVIVSDKSVSLKHDSIDFIYKPNDILGKITIHKLDDMVSEGVIEKNGFFDLINPGDAVLIGKIPAEKERDRRTIPDVPLYRRILQIR
jgi:tetratricopeptide (TPR) repeat protein